jgi:hypothetical protein
MKGGNSGNNGSDLDMGNTIKPTFDTMMKEGRKAFKAYQHHQAHLWHHDERGSQGIQSLSR